MLPQQDQPLCFFKSTKKLPSRRQKLEASRRISGYALITSLRISFGTPSIPGAVFALSLLPALISSSRVKSSSRRTSQELRFCLWNGSTCGNKLRTMWQTQPSSSMIVVSSRCSRSLSLLSRLVFQEGLLPSPPLPLSTAWHRCSKLDSMHWWSLKVIISRTDQSLIFEARRIAAIVRSIIASAMSRDDFLNIKSNMKLSLPEDKNNEDKVWEVRKVLDIFRSNI